MMQPSRLTSHRKPLLTQSVTTQRSTLRITMDSRIHARDALFAGRARILWLVQIGIIDYF